MPETTALPTVDELFAKWLGFLDGGALTTATFVAGDRPDLINALQSRINTYLADRAANVEDTFTAVSESTVNESTPVLADYTILGPLGAGGMGVVYRVRDNLDREWALKLARHDQLTEAARARFQDEARAMARLDGHPNVAPVRHLGTTTTGQPYFVMPVYPSNLTSRLAEYQADPVKAVELMAAVAEGVAHLHSRDFIHRDLKPHNILIDANGRPAVSDFGLVKCLSDASSESPTAPVASGSGETKPSGARRSKTVAGAAMGTRAYMAPEQAAGLTHLANPRWDVWALGVILHELLTGERPQSSLSPEALLDPRAPGNPAPSEIKPEIDPRLERIVKKCLARNEKDRYASAGEVARALREWAKPKPRRRRRVAFITGILVLAAAASVVALWPTRDSVTADQDSPALSPGPDPVTTGQNSLQQGKTVELIPATGPPHWHRVVVGPPSAVRTDGAAREQPVIIDTNVALVADLFPDPGVDTYRYEMEMKSSGPPNSQVGLCVGRHPEPTPHGEFQTFVGLGFNDAAATGPMGKWELKIRSICEDAAGIHVHRDQDVMMDVYPTPPSGPEEGWHHLAVDVTPKTLIWSFDGKQVSTVLRQPAEVDQLQFRRRLKLDASRTLEFPPRCPVGVFVLSGIAHCRNGKITAPAN